MSNDAAVKVTADATGYTAEITRAMKVAGDFTLSQTQMSEKIAASQRAISEAAASGSTASAKSIDKFTASLAKQAAQAGMTSAQILQMKAANLGISQSVSGYISSIEAASQSTHGFSLATGGARRELAVLAHEAGTGNWTRFAGSLGVLAERTGVINLLFSSFGVGLLASAAAVAGVVYEIVKGAEAFNALQKASSATNDYIGLTAGQLKQMAVELAGVSGSVTAASETLTLLVASGHIAGESLLAAGQAAQDFAKQTGLAADKSTEAMIAFAEDPAKALDNLQGKYHEFSQAQIDVIAGFIKQGNTEAAVAAGFADIIANSSSMAKSIVGDVGYIEGSYDTWKARIQGLINDLGNLGKASTNADKLATAMANVQLAQKNLDSAKSRNPLGFDTSAAATGLATAQATLAIAQQQNQADATKATADKQRALAGDSALASAKYRQTNKYANPKDKQTADITGENAAFAEATKGLDKASADYQADLKQHLDAIAQINATYAKKTKGPSNNDAINAQIKALDSQTNSLKSIYTQQNDAAEAAYKTGATDAQTFTALQLQYQEQELSGELAIAEKQAELAKGKKQTAAYQEYLVKVKNIQNQMVDAASKAAASIQEANQKQADSVAKFADGQNNKVTSQQQGFDDKNAIQGMTPDAAAQYQARENLQREYYATMQQLSDQYKTHQLTDGEFSSDVNAAAIANDAMNAQQTTQYAKQLADRNNYNVQVSSALVKSTGDAQTNAQLTGEAFSSAYSTMSSQLEEFVTTGKGSWASFAEAIIADMAKIALQAAETQIFSTALSFVGGSGGITDAVGGGTRSFAVGGDVAGPGTGTSDSIPAMLSNGEFVMTASATKKYGSLLRSLNNGVGHYATGGAVGNVAPNSGGSTTSLSLSLGASNQGLTKDDLNAIAPHIQQLIDKRMAQKMNGQGGYSYQMRNGMI